ncbi:hypothetical protein CerSpe_202130 [Prunus speciosa]
MKKLELVFIPAPGTGHLVPVFELAKRLIGHDDRISATILAIKSTFPSSVDSKTKSLAASNPQIKLVDVPKVDPPPQELFIKVTSKVFLSIY